MAAAPQQVVIDQPLAEVIHLFGPPSCFTCANARFPERSTGVITYCALYSEEILSEAISAEDCSTYEVCEAGSQPDDFYFEDEL